MRSMWRFSACLMIMSIIFESGYGYPNDEVYALSGLRNVVTDPDKQLATWDPTNDTPCHWDHISCNEYVRVAQLDLKALNLGGNLSRTLGLNLHDLQYLYLSENNFEASIPAWIGNLTKLFVLDLHSNKFTGTIPSIANLASLTTLDLSNNALCGNIPEEIKRIPNLNIANNPGLGGSGPCP